MKRIALFLRVLVLALLSNIFVATSATAQAVSAEAFSSAGQCFSSTPMKTTAPWTPISQLDLALEKHDPFTYIHFYNDRVDIFDPCRNDCRNECRNECSTLVASTNGAVGPMMRRRDKTPTLLVYTNGPIKIQRKSNSKPPLIATEKFDEKKRLSLVRAAKQSSDADAPYYLAQANLLSKNWNEAWRQGEIIFKKSPDDEKRTKEMMELYSQAPERYMEYCIWCTRYLRVAKDRKSFQSAFFERQRIETICSARYPELDDERTVDAPIDVKHPLAVFFSKNAEYISQFCVKQFEKWTVASGFKLCFYRVDNARNADITFEVKSERRPYAENITPHNVPTGYPRRPRLGETVTRADKSGRTKSLITMYIENLPDLNFEMLSCICLHEVGHALGLLRHTSGQGDVMDLYCGDPPLTRLSKRDCQRAKELYKKAPISDAALRQFALKMNAW